MAETTPNMPRAGNEFSLRNTGIILIIGRLFEHERS